MNSFMVVYGYAAVVAIVGTLGYVLKKSVPSIAAGVLSAIILVIAGRAIQQGQGWGFPTALVVTILLLLNFAMRYMNSKTHEFWPNGLMAVVSLLALVALIISVRGRS
ncbi:MAG TPA: TMEM14 family protein [Abditibacteriaceae bacterium]